MDEIKKTADKIVTASHGSGRDAISGIFDGFIELSRLVQAAGKIKAEKRNERRRLKARQRYALNKKLGIPNRKPKAVPEPDYEAPTSCYCSTCRMPPCGWCESGAGQDDDEF